MYYFWVPSRKLHANEITKEDLFRDKNDTTKFITTSTKLIKHQPPPRIPSFRQPPVPCALSGPTLGCCKKKTANRNLSKINFIALEFGVPASKHTPEREREREKQYL